MGSGTVGEKSKVLAGVLAIIPGTGETGIHRFYLGSIGMGIVHIVLFFVGLLFCFIPLGVFIGFPMLLGNGIWAKIEAIMIFTGSIKDADGNELK